MRTRLNGRRGIYEMRFEVRNKSPPVLEPFPDAVGCHTQDGPYALEYPARIARPTTYMTCIDWK